MQAVLLRSTRTEGHIERHCLKQLGKSFPDILLDVSPTISYTAVDSLPFHVFDLCRNPFTSPSVSAVACCTPLEIRATKKRMKHTMQP